VSRIKLCVNVRALINDIIKREFVG